MFRLWGMSRIHRKIVSYDSNLTTYRYSPYFYVPISRAFIQRIGCLTAKHFRFKFEPRIFTCKGDVKQFWHISHPVSYSKRNYYIGIIISNSISY